jgi:hypothetical protein
MVITTEAGKKRPCMHRTWPKREAFRSDGCSIDREEGRTKLLGERYRCSCPACNGTV